ncbi:MAG TPA: hypothetical protein VGF32_00345, partial [Streptosporangiaceae bacterium]
MGERPAGRGSKGEEPGSLVCGPLVICWGRTGRTLGGVRNARPGVLRDRLQVRRIGHRAASGLVLT